ncbi:MAG TPA: DegT/DnrJ/EryC1/StrS family aminotransferase [bacterium]|nr:DegT/DnrJ/EryC1/StrS family aminotransferase [bacterium]
MIPVFSNSLGEEELQAVASTFKSKWIGVGKETRTFEKELSDKLDCPTIATNSCTSALFMSMKLLDIGLGDEVIIPSIHFIGAANAIIDSGASPVFADVDLRYLNILPEEITRLRTDRTRAVMLLHYGGHPAAMDEIRERSDGLRIIEDSANSPFSIYKGRSCGTLGDAGCLSFDSMKILCTGNGGAICLRDEELYQAALEHRYYGLRAMGQSGVDSLKEKSGRWWEVDLNRISGKCESNDIISAIGRVQLGKVDGFIERRKEVWKAYQEGLSGSEWLERPPEPLPQTESSYYFYWVKTKERDRLAQHLVDNGIYCTFKYSPLHLVKQYNADVKLPNAELLSETVLNIPLHQNLSDEDVTKVTKTIKNFGLEEMV